jgi:phage baseplate assembly protein W
VPSPHGADRIRGFLGTGFAFPFGVDGRGGIALATEEQAIERSIKLILSTAFTERRMRSNFGCGIHDLVFGSNDATMIGLIRYHVTEALGWWEPRITVADVQVDSSPDDPAQVLVVIRYVIKATNDERNLVYPFYMIPGEE